jgi:type IV secretion system protein TrbL
VITFAFFLTSWLSSAASGLVGDILSPVLSAISSAAAAAIKGITTFWVSIPTPNLTDQASGAPSTAVAYLQSHLAFYAGAAVAFSVIIAVIRMAWEQHHGAGTELLKGLLIYLAVTGASVTVIALMVDASDQFSSWIIAGSLNGHSLQSSVDAMIGLSYITNGSAVFLGIILGLFALVASLIQCMLMIIRGGMLVILTGVLPLTFAFWTTESGKQWSKKSTSWLIAFVLYKPAAAIVYAAAFRLISDQGTGNGLVNSLTGLALMFMAVLALPALMRFVTPMVSSIAAGGAGMMVGAAGVVAGAAMLPTGAAALGGAASTGMSAPSGAAMAGSTGGSVSEGSGAVGAGSTNGLLRSAQLGGLAGSAASKGANGAIEGEGAMGNE